MFLHLGFQGIFFPSHSAIPTFLCGGITTLGVCFMPSKRWARRGHGGVMTPCRILLPVGSASAHSGSQGQTRGRFPLSVTA